MSSLVVNGVLTPTQLFDCAGNRLDIINADLAFGVPKESSIIKTLSKYFNESVEKANYKYCPFDAESKLTKYEIKSRRNTYSAFPTTIIPVDKTERISGDRLVFVFNFIDGLYYIVHHKETFAEYEVKDIKAYRNGGVQTYKPHYMIPIEDLIQIII